MYKCIFLCIKLHLMYYLTVTQGALTCFGVNFSVNGGPNVHCADQKECVLLHPPDVQLERALVTEDKTWSSFQ